MNKHIVMLFTACFFLQSCLVFKTVGIKADDIKTYSEPTVIKSPFKIHLKDGRNVLFRDGASFQGDRFFGAGLF